MYIDAPVAMKMLKNTFQHIPGIGPKTERQLWACGITDWSKALQCRCRCPKAKSAALAGGLQESLSNVDLGNPGYFSDRLPANLHWRLFPEFRHKTAYFDIETTGLDRNGCDITSIALYDGERVRYYVQGNNLEDFVDDIQCYLLLVTYNGGTFDVPFVERYFHISLDQVHIDLRYVLKSLGYTGGLKRCEKALGLSRGGLEGVDGYFAVRLWHDYQYNDNPKALETLLAYNIADAVNLEALMVMAYNLKIATTPFGRSRRLSVPPEPERPFNPDPATIQRIREAQLGRYIPRRF